MKDDDEIVTVILFCELREASFPTRRRETQSALSVSITVYFLGYTSPRILHGKQSFAGTANLSVTIWIAKRFVKRTD